MVPYQPSLLACVFCLLAEAVTSASDLENVLEPASVHVFGLVSCDVLVGPCVPTEFFELLLNYVVLSCGRRLLRFNHQAQHSFSVGVSGSSLHLLFPAVILRFGDIPGALGSSLPSLFMKILVVKSLDGAVGTTADLFEDSGLELTACLFRALLRRRRV